MNHKKIPRVALGAWSWGTGMAGGDQVFGNHLTEEELKPVFASAMQHGLNLWDTAAVYGEGSSELILGNFIKDVPRDKVIVSTKGTLPIIGVTRPKHVEDAAKAAMLELTPHEMYRMEELAEKTPVKTLREWEKDM